MRPLRLCGELKSAVNARVHYKKEEQIKNVFISFMVVAVLGMRLDNANGSDQQGPITPWTIVVTITTLSIPLRHLVVTSKKPFLSTSFRRYYV